jgi:PAS domain-containing protein
MRCGITGSCRRRRAVRLSLTVNGDAAWGQASPPCAIWHQVVDGFPAPIAVADRGGSIVAANRAFRIALKTHHVIDEWRLDECDSCLANAIRCAASSSVPVLCQSGVARDICFECRPLDQGGLVALIGRVA